MHRPVGIMLLWDKRGVDTFDADDYSLADSLGTQAAALLVEEQLSEFEDIQAAFTTVPIGLMLIGTDNRVIVANQAARQIVDQTNLTARTLSGIDYQEQLKTLVDNVRNDKTGQKTFVAPDGDSFIVSGQRTSEGQVIIAFSSSPVNQDAEELVGQVAHELRTPLTVIQGNLQTVEALFEGEMQPEDADLIQEFIGTSLIQSNRMYRMIDETLNLSRIHVGKELELDVHKFDLIEAINQVYLELEDRLMRNNIVTEAPDTLIMEGDSAKITSIVDNFLKNACKYSEPGTTVTLRVEVENATIALSVKDEGIGIPKDAIHKIGNEAGFRTDVSKRQAGGIGLGMIYTRRVIEAHGGQMKIESKLGKGSKFTAILPIRQS